MPGRLRITLLACAIAATVAGCGSGDDGTIPSADSEELLRQIDAIENDVQTGNCELAQQHATAFAERVSQLPADVDAEVRQGLSDASTRLIELSAQPGQCEEVTGASGETGVQPTTTEEETTTDDETTTEDETTTTEEDEEPPPEEEPPPDDEGDDSGDDQPLEPPSGDGGNGDGGSGGRGGSDSGGVEPQRGGAKRSRAAPPLRRLVRRAP